MRWKGLTKLRKITKRALAVVLLTGAAMIVVLPGFAAERFITLASTTSTENSGLFDAILPQFTIATGIGVRVVAVGTGAALRLDGLSPLTMLYSCTSSK